MTIYHVWINNKEYLVDISNGGAHLIHEGDSKTKPLPNLKSFVYLIQGQAVVVQEERKSKHSRQEQPTGDKNIHAPMPGIIISIMIQEGQTVTVGQPLLVMESMKMQMEIRAPISGTVSIIATNASTKVEKDALLIQIKSL